MAEVNLEKFCKIETLIWLIWKFWPWQHCYSPNVREQLGAMARAGMVLALYQLWNGERKEMGKGRGMGDRTPSIVATGPLVLIWKEATLTVYIFCSGTVALFLLNKSKRKSLIFQRKERTWDLSYLKLFPQLLRGVKLHHLSFSDKVISKSAPRVNCKYVDTMDWYSTYLRALNLQLKILKIF